jgi:hypothetical protein
VTAGAVNGWSPRIRQITAAGSSSHGRLSASTAPNRGVARAPYRSSIRMISTLASIVPDQTSAGTRIQSRPRANAYRAAK